MSDHASVKVQHDDRWLIASRRGGGTERGGDQKLLNRRKHHCIITGEAVVTLGRDSMLRPDAGCFICFLGLLPCCVEEPPPDSIGPAALLGDALCHWLVGCECDVTFSDERQCRDAMTALLELEHASALQAGLILDEHCVDAWVDEWNAQECEATENPPERCGAHCPVFHGEVPLGDACRWHGNFHDCSRGLDCHEVCVKSCRGPLGEGVSCVPNGSPSCDHVAELYCARLDPTTAHGVCTPVPQAGEACPDGWCSDDTYCDDAEPGSSVCLTRAGVGEACTDPYVPCIHGSYCAASGRDLPVCRPVPDLGEQCLDGTCLAGLRCDETGDKPVCALGSDGEPCETSHDCLSNECLEGICVPRPPAVCAAADSLPPR